MSEERGIWKEVLHSKYGHESVQTHTPIKHQSRWWKDLLKVCSVEGMIGWFQKAIGWKIGAGDKARFFMV